MLFAFVVYKRLLATNLLSFVDRSFEFNLLTVHLDRIKDIVLAPQEKGLNKIPIESRSSGRKPELRLENIWFRYSENEDYILRDVSLKIRSGKTTVITGKTGVGKTTIVKLLLGLLEPSRGRVLFNGRPTTHFDVNSLRSVIGNVMQNDQLFSGSILDNVTFFDPNIDFENLYRSCRLACIHEEIEAFPMGYDTPIGNIGTGLSGGQEQRIYIARALYKSPQILILDEGTANLDVQTEARVLYNLRELGIATLHIAHRKTVLEEGNHLFVLDRRGCLEEHVGAPPVSHSPEIAGSENETEYRYHGE